MNKSKKRNIMNQFIKTLSVEMEESRYDSESNTWKVLRTFDAVIEPDESIYNKSRFADNAVGELIPTEEILVHTRAQLESRNRRFRVSSPDPQNYYFSITEPSKLNELVSLWETGMQRIVS